MWQATPRSSVIWEFHKTALRTFDLFFIKKTFLYKKNFLYSTGLFDYFLLLFFCDTIVIVIIIIEGKFQVSVGKKRDRT